MSSPAKQQPNTPTLNSLLRQPSAITTPTASTTAISGGGPTNVQQPAPVGTLGGNGSGPGQAYAVSYSPGLIPNDQPQPPPQMQPQQSDYYQNRMAVKGSVAGNNYIPDGRYGNPTGAPPFQQPQIPQQHHLHPSPHQFHGAPGPAGYPQPGIANGPSPQSPRTPVQVAGQMHGQKQPVATTNSAHEPMVNGIPPMAKGATLPGQGQGEQSTSQSGPKHPSVTALRQEANASSPAGTRNASPSPVSLAAPSSPASMMRHSPVSPTPVSVYNQSGAYHGQPTTSTQFGQVPNQQPQPQQPQQMQQPGHTGYYDGNYHYGQGYGPSAAPAPGIHPQGAPGNYAAYNTGTPNFANGPATGTGGPVPYYGHQPQQQFAAPPPSNSSGVPTPTAPNSHVQQGPYGGGPEQMPNQQAYYGQVKNDSRTANGPIAGYPPGVHEASRITASPAVSDTSDPMKDPGRNGSGTPNVDRHRTSTPATMAERKLRVNGAKGSHPSTPGSPGAASDNEAESSLSSPSWPRTPMSPALRNQPPQMGPPPPVANTSGSGPSGSSKDGGASLVARLLGDPVQLGCSPQEWSERRAFYERLVQYCESNSHPITAQPTVSKQTVDLYRLYMSVRQRGGFEEVTKKKQWRELCTIFGISQSNSASGQLKKQYSRFLFPFECYYDMHGVDPQPILASLESKKKNKKSSAAAAAAAASAGPGASQPRQMPIFPPQQQQQSQQYSGDSFMGPPAVPYSASGESAGQSSATNASGQGQHQSAPPMGQYQQTAPPYMQQMQHPRPMAPPQQRPSGSNEAESGAPGHQMGYYSGTPAPVPTGPQTAASAGHYPNAPRMPVYSGATYQTQPPTPATGMPAPESGQRPQTQAHPTTSDGQPSNTQIYPASTHQQFGPPSGQPASGASQMPPAPGQSGYPNQMTSPNTSGYQPVQYSHEPSGPPNQYLTPQGPRYHGPTSSTGTSEVAPASGMISHSYRSGVPVGMSYGAGMYSGPQQSSASTYMPQPQQSDNSQNTGTTTNYPLASGDNYNAPNTAYMWSNQRPPQPGQPPPGGARFGPGYPPPPAGMPQNAAEYAKASSRAGQPTYPRPATAATYTPAGMSPYATVPPNMSLRNDLGMKSLPTGAPPYTHPMMAQTAVKKELSPISIFPPGSVEATTFTAKKRRKLLAKDIGSVEAWRLVMALRSGLEAETTWALNSLNILLYDDSSVMYFGLANLPGLLEALVEHWRRSLMDLLEDIFSIEEVASKPRCCQNSAESTQETDVKPNDIGDQVLDYQSGLWDRGGGSSTEHLKCKFDPSLDECSLRFGCVQRRDNVEKCNPLKRKRMDSGSTMEDTPIFFYSDRKYEESDEIEMHNNLPLQTAAMSTRQLVDRCVSISNAIRGLSFIPSNEVPMSKHAGLLRVLAKLLLLCHNHVDRGTKSLLKNCINDQMDDDANEIKSDSVDDSGKSESQSLVDLDDPLWFWDDILRIVDDAFVILCNLSTNLDLCDRSEQVSLPLLDALLHWAVCRSPTAHDTLVPGSYVSPHRYAVEILCKLSVQERNVDLLLATPPWERIEYLLELLSTMSMVGEEIMMREFAVVLIHALCNASPVACVAAALKTKTLQNLMIFLEQADANMHQVVQSHGMQVLRDNPELIGTSVGMLRRAASTLLFMAKIPSCHHKFNRYQQRLLHFTMSHLMDSRVAATVAEALFELQKGGDPVSASLPPSKSEPTSIEQKNSNVDTPSADAAISDQKSGEDTDKMDDGQSRESTSDAGEIVVKTEPNVDIESKQNDHSNSSESAAVVSSNDTMESR